MSTAYEGRQAVLTVWRIGGLKHGRMNIRSGTFLAGLDAVLNEEAVGEGGIEVGIGCSDHLWAAHWRRGEVETGRSKHGGLKR